MSNSIVPTRRFLRTAAVMLLVAALLGPLASCGSNATTSGQNSILISAANHKIVLSGSTFDAASSARLQSAAEILAGPNNVDNQLEVVSGSQKAPSVPKPEALILAMADVFFPWTIKVSTKGSVELTGSVASAKTRDAAIAAAKKAFPAGDVRANIKILSLPSTTVPDASSRSTTTAATEAIIHPIQFFYTAVSVTLAGDVADAATKSALLAQAKAEYNPSAVKDNLTINPSSPAKAVNFQSLFHGFPMVDTWTFTFGGKGVVIQGNITEAVARSQIVATLNTVLKGVPIDDRLAVFAQRRDLISTTTSAGSSVPPSTAP